MNVVDHPHLPAWPGPDPAGSVLLPLPLFLTGNGGHPTLLMPAGTLARKSEFHVTLLNREAGAAVALVLGERRIRELFESIDWSWMRTGDGELIRKHKVMGGMVVECWSLIERLALPGMRQFRQALANESGIALPLAIPHVTLYTAGDPEGIGLPDKESHEALKVADVRLPGSGNRRPPPLTADLLAAYGAAEFVIHANSEITLCAGKSSQPMNALLRTHSATHAVVITSCNPFSEPPAELANCIRQDWLRQDIEASGRHVWGAEGQDPSRKWPPESSWLILDPEPSSVQRLLLDHEQHAVLVLTLDYPARLQLHPAHLQAASSRGNG